MKITLIEIGNSKGIRLPKAIIEQLGFKDIIKAEIKNGKLILSSIQIPRTGWKESFKEMSKSGDDQLLEPDIFSISTDKKDWKW